MNKSELIDALADATDSSKTQAKAHLDAFIDVLGKNLKKGPVAIAGLGTFSVRKRAARIGRNPQTGEAIKIKASKSPAFKAAKALKDRV
jgi:DNA-binding protein HU-beta